MLEDSSVSWFDKPLLKSISSDSMSSVHTTISGATSDDSSDEPSPDTRRELKTLLGDAVTWLWLLATDSAARLDIEEEESVSCVGCEKVGPIGTSFSRLR
jgi:hypothetical protein